jgi:chromosome segregation ATPase
MTMSKSVQNAEVLKEEKERVYAELMFLSKSFKELQLSLETSKQSYEQRICNYEEEAAMKEQLILHLRRELEVAEEKIGTLESQVADLTAELVEERSKNEELASIVSSLRSELDVMRSNADGFDEIITILRSEKESYERQLSDERDSTSSLRKKRADLEDLISKTRDSLVLEKERVANDMNERDNRIAQIDSDLAEQKIENESLKQSLKQTTDRYNSEKARVERLNAQLETARRNLPLTNADHDDELETLTNRICELSSSKDELGSMLSKTESKLGLMTQQLLLSNQHISNKQSEIARLKEELSTVTSTAVDSSQASLHDNLSALTAEVEELKSSARRQKAKANEKIILVNQKLEEKEAEIMKLQNKIEELVRINKADHEIKPAADNEELLDLKASIVTLQISLKDAQMKQKEKIQLKNQSLKEKEDTIEKLQADLIDLQSEKERLSTKLNEQVKRREDECRSHELQLKSTEDRLTKENLAVINALEEEMNETIHQLELEVKLLKKKVADGDLIGSTATIAQAKRMHDLENALRQSKEKEVSLLNENLKYKHRLENLLFVQAKASKETVASFPVKSMGEEKQKDVPAYFKEKRPLVRIVGNAWRKVFSRKKKL